MVRDADGTEVARSLGTAVFARDDRLLRVVHYRGDLGRLLLHIGRSLLSGGLARELAPHLPENPSIDSAEAFAAFFRHAQLPCVYQRGRGDPT
ncbi:SchA/CurD-like domain-containing protein [Embleya sp. NPDC056575]|uniref:SchA/CurD-like domain-containing protein n=1 Tax=unclassified Embleya TaxID=2699296 RepID=UPI003685AAFF